jgi:hypothetical protein
LDQLLELGLVEQVSPDYYVRSSEGDRVLTLVEEPTPKDSSSLDLHRLKVFLLIAVVSMAFWLIPPLYPVNVLAVFIHEANHALAVVLTGGHVVTMAVTPWESGYVQYRGGNPQLIIAAGYVGSVLVGGVMLFFSGREMDEHHLCRSSVVFWARYRLLRPNDLWACFWFWQRSGLYSAHL